jgi:hypothetical protein
MNLWRGRGLNHEHDKGEECSTSSTNGIGQMKGIRRWSEEDLKVEVPNYFGTT